VLIEYVYGLFAQTAEGPLMLPGTGTATTEMEVEAVVLQVFVPVFVAVTA